MKVSIFIRSYRGDREWLTYCLKYLKSRATGFHETVVALPYGDEPHFGNYDFQGARLVWVHDVPTDGYMAQQACKMEADLHVTGDNVLYIDSDCMATRPFDACEFFPFGKPLQLIRFWSDLDGDALGWKRCVHRILREEPKFEHMATHPMIYHTGSITRCRQFIDGLHGSMREYVRTCPRRDLSELNTMGAFCHLYEPHLYDWRRAGGDDGYPRPLKQYHSWDGIAKYIEEVKEL